MRRWSLLLVCAGCTATTAEFVAEQEGYVVTQGFVIRLRNLHSPEVTELKDGVAYRATEKGATVVLEFPGNRGDPRARKPRKLYRLQPGDLFINSRPFSYVLQRPGGR